MENLEIMETELETEVAEDYDAEMDYEESGSDIGIAFASGLVAGALIDRVGGYIAAKASPAISKVKAKIAQRVCKWPEAELIDEVFEEEVPIDYTK